MNISMIINILRNLIYIRNTRESRMMEGSSKIQSRFREIAITLINYLLKALASLILTVNYQAISKPMIEI